MEFDTLAMLGIGLVVCVVVLTVGALIVDKLKDQTTVGSTAENISIKGLTAIDSMADWFPIIVVAVVGALIIGIIMSYLGFSGGRSTAGYAY
jgi:hypothetical protein